MPTAQARRITLHIRATMRRAAPRIASCAGLAADPGPGSLRLRPERFVDSSLLTMSKKNPLLSRPIWLRRQTGSSASRHRPRVSPALMSPVRPDVAGSRSCPAGFFNTSASSAGGGVPSDMASICARAGWASGIAPRIGRNARDDPPMLRSPCTHHEFRAKAAAQAEQARPVAPTGALSKSTATIRWRKPHESLAAPRARSGAGSNPVP